MIQVELLNLTFENERRRNQDSNVKFAPLERFQRMRSRRGGFPNRANAERSTSSAPSKLGKYLPDKAQPIAGANEVKPFRRSWGTMPQFRRAFL
jgi:hypothetical protein